MPFFRGTRQVYLGARTKPPIIYDTDAAAYFAKIASVGPPAQDTEKNAVNTLILGMKSASIWTKMDRLYLRSPASFAASLLCAKTLTSQTAVNMTDADWSAATGVNYDGISKYLRGDVALNTLSGLTATSFAAGSYMGISTFTGNAKVLIGCEHSDGTNQMFVAFYQGLS